MSETDLYTVLPGATLGVLGNGQLGRMFAIAARQLGYRVHTFGPEADSPAGQVADRAFVADFDDAAALSEFAQSVAVITLEFENVPVATTTLCQDYAPVRPAGRVLYHLQHRVREKEFLAAHGLPVTPFVAVDSQADLDKAVTLLGLPAVLKTCECGYDGKGQTILRTSQDTATAWDRLGRQPTILEAFVDYIDEFSVVLARREDGQVAVYAPIHNTHHHHILDVSLFPAAIDPEQARAATDIALAVAQALDYIGVLCVEMFRCRDGRILINEIAPRPHNSGHLTIEACPASQFEQQVRAICGLPLGSTVPRQAAAMANLLGDLWYSGSDDKLTEPHWSKALSMDVALHLYGKAEPRRGRKMGHVTALAATPAAAEELVLAARQALTAQVQEH